MSECPCGSGRSYETCCGPLISGAEAAPTAEALMRSRYSAYVQCEIDYLGETLHPGHRSDYDAAATRRWAEGADWLGLEIGDVEQGGEEGPVLANAGEGHLFPCPRRTEPMYPPFVQ